MTRSRLAHRSPRLELVVALSSAALVAGVALAGGPCADNDSACATECAAPGEIGTDLRVTDDDSYTTGLPTVVWNGTDYAMVWLRGIYIAQELHYQLFFRRFDVAGVPVGPLQELLLRQDSLGSLSLVWTGTEYGLAVRVGPYPYRVLFYRLDADGLPLDVPLEVADDTTESGRPDLVWTGSEYAIVWYDGPVGESEWQLYFARISAAGDKLGADVQLTATGYQVMSSLVWNGAGFGLAWVRNHQDPDGALWFARLDASGNKIGADVSVAPVDGWGLDDGLVWTGSEYAIAFFSGGFPDPEVYLARLDATGTEIGQEQLLAVDTGTEVSEVSTVSLTFNGSEFELHWVVIRYGVTGPPCSLFTYESTFWFSRVDATGALQGPMLQVNRMPGPMNLPQIVWNGSQYGAFWADSRECLGNVYFTTIGCDCSLDGDADGFSVSCDDCDDADPTVRPGGAQVCDGVNNDCNHVNWPGLEGTNEDDIDGDTFSLCTGDCNDNEGATFPGAVEVNDGLDNQCAGYPGFGLVDETSGDSGFHNPANKNEYSWPAQSGATLYAVARSLDPLFGDCVGFDTSATTWGDSKVPAAGAVFYYLNRAVAPNAGSWGRTTAGFNRNPVCTAP